MNHAVVGQNVRHNHLGVVDEHAVGVDRHRHVSAVERRHHHAVRQVRAQRRAAHHVVGQDGRQQIDVCKNSLDRARGKRCKSGVRRCEHRERTFAAQRLHKASSHHSRLKRRVIFAVDDDVHHRVGWQGVDRDGGHHALSGMFTNAAIVIVRARSVERHNAQTNPIHVA